MNRFAFRLSCVLLIAALMCCMTACGNRGEEVSSAPPPTTTTTTTTTAPPLGLNPLTGVEDMTLVTPSRWLADLAGQSFLKEYPVRVIHNGIDLSVFKPTQSTFRAKYGISEEKKILLGVAFGWGERKGLDVFLELAKRLDDSYRIVLVGTDEKVDAQLPGNIVSIHRTNDQQELAEIYAAADLFVNPTREDTYPTVNMESLACGTPVLTFRTGGSPEIPDETCGAVVEKDDLDSLEREMWIWSLQFSNLQRILSGEEPLKMDSLMQDRSALSEYAYSDLYQYEDSLLRDKIDRVERFNLSENRNRDLGLEALVLFPPVKGVVSSAYEEARHPYIDLAVEENSVVSSVLDGTVVFAGWQDETGYTMYIQHRDDLISVYKHNAKLLRQAGDKVTAGMPVAMSGNTGHLTTGPHLHFELWYRGMPIDPIKYMKL